MIRIIGGKSPYTNRYYAIAAGEPLEPLEPLNTLHSLTGQDKFSLAAASGSRFALVRRNAS